MPPLPPLKDVLEALQQLVLPAAAGAALVTCLFLLMGRWSAALGSAVAVVAGFFWANSTDPYTDVLSDPSKWQDVGRIPWKPGESPKVFQWFPQAALVLTAVGLASRWLAVLVARAMPPRLWWGAIVLMWLPRVGAVIAVSSWLVIGNAAQAPEWVYLRWELAAVILLPGWCWMDSRETASVRKFRPTLVWYFLQRGDSALHAQQDVHGSRGDCRFRDVRHRRRDRTGEVESESGNRRGSELQSESQFV